MSDVTLFWLIHLFVGLVLPILVYTGCCRREEEKQERARLQRMQHEAEMASEPVSR